MYRNAFALTAAFLFSMIVMVACDKNDDPPAPTMVKEWNISLSAKNENPGVPGRSETGTAAIKLYSDKSIQYTITVNNLAAGDALTNAHFHSGDPVSNGPVVLGFNPAFSGSTATGTITNVRQSLYDSLLNSANQVYFNVHSSQVPAGLVRGQANSANELSMDIALSGANEVPAVTTTAVGIAMVRLTADKKLYTKVTVTNLDAGDALTAAHYHKAAAGTNAGVFLGIYATAAEFGTVKVSTLDDAQFASMKTDAMYVNAHSTMRPAGLVRGQLR